MKSSSILNQPIPIFLSFIMLLLSPLNLAALEVHPGNTYSNIMSEAEAVSDCNNPVIHGCNYDVDLSDNWIRAIVNPAVPGYDQLSVSIYKDFSVAASSNGNENNLVGSYLDVVIRYAGHLEGMGVFQRAGYEVNFYVRDLTDNRIIATENVSSGTVSGSLEVGTDLIPFPVRDYLTAASQDRVALSLPLSTGKDYRIVMNVVVEANAFNSNLIVSSDFFSNIAENWGSFLDFGGVKWSSLSLTVGTDPFQAVDSLRELLETHTHVYLTGRGVGHNNTEAITSMAVFMDSTVITDDVMEILPEVGDNLNQVTAHSKLHANYPNPFNPSTTISYSLANATNVKIVIYNSLGQTVKTLVDEFQPSGDHSVVFDAGDFASGVYYYRLLTDSFVETRKLVLLK